MQDDGCGVVFFNNSPCYSLEQPLVLLVVDAIVYGDVQAVRLAGIPGIYRARFVNVARARDDVSTTTNEHDSDSDNNYNGEDEDGDKIINDTDNVAETRFDTPSAYVHPDLVTLLNGPQWEPPDPGSRRAPRVNYSLREAFAQPTTERPVRAPKVCIAPTCPNSCVPRHTLIATEESSGKSSWELQRWSKSTRR